MDAPNVVEVPFVTRQNALPHEQWHEEDVNDLTNQMATTNIGILPQDGVANPLNASVTGINAALRDELGMVDIDLSGRNTEVRMFPPETRDAQVRIAAAIRVLVGHWFPELTPLMRPMGNIENGTFHFGHHLFWHLTIMHNLTKHALHDPSAHSERQVSSARTLHHLFNPASIQDTYRLMNLPTMA